MLKNRIQSIIDKANITTGKSDNNMTTATQSLIDGYIYKDNFDLIINGNISEVRSNVKSVRDYAFARCRNMKVCELPECVSLGSHSFNANSTEKLVFPKVRKLGDQVFGYSRATSIDFYVLEDIPAATFAFNSSIVAVILRSPTVVTLASVNAFNGTQIESGTGYIYVPKSIAEQYKTSTNWSNYEMNIRSIEDYPDITGGVL